MAATNSMVQHGFDVNAAIAKAKQEAQQRALTARKQALAPLRARASAPAPNPQPQPQGQASPPSPYSFRPQATTIPSEQAPPSSPSTPSNEPYNAAPLQGLQSLGGSSAEGDGSIINMGTPSQANPMLGQRNLALQSLRLAMQPKIY